MEPMETGPSDAGSGEGSSRPHRLTVGAFIVALAAIALALIVPRVTNGDGPLALASVDPVLRSLEVSCAQLLPSPEEEPILDEVVVSACTTPSDDGVYLLTSRTSALSPPSLTPELADRLCQLMSGGYSVAQGPDYMLAVPATDDGSTRELMDTLKLDPRSISCSD